MTKYRVLKRTGLKCIHRKIMAHKILAVLIISLMLASTLVPLFWLIGNDTGARAQTIHETTGYVDLYPNADNLAQWTRNTGSANYDTVNDETRDDDTTYVEQYSVSGGLYDRYGLSNYTDPNRPESLIVIESVQITDMWVRKTGVPTANFIFGVANQTGSGGDHQILSTTALYQTYTNYVEAAMTTNPMTSSAWTFRDLENLTVYITSSDASPAIRCTMIRVEITMTYIWWDCEITSDTEVPAFELSTFSHEITANETIESSEPDPTAHVPISSPYKSEVVRGWFYLRPDGTYNGDANTYGAGTAPDCVNDTDHYYKSGQYPDSYHDGDDTYVLTTNYWYPSFTNPSAWVRLAPDSAIDTVYVYMMVKSNDASSHAYTCWMGDASGGYTNLGGGTATAAGYSVFYSSGVSPRGGGSWTWALLDGACFSIHDPTGSAVRVTDMFFLVTLDSPYYEYTENWLALGESNNTVYCTLPNGVPDGDSYAGYEHYYDVEVTTTPGGWPTETTLTVTIEEPWAPCFTSSPVTNAVDGIPYSYTVTTNESATYEVSITGEGAAESGWTGWINPTVYQYGGYLTGATTAYIASGDWPYAYYNIMKYDLSSLDSDLTLNTLYARVYGPTYDNLGTYDSTLTVNATEAFGGTTGSVTRTIENIKSLFPAGSFAFYMDTYTGVSPPVQWHTDSGDVHSTWQTQYDYNKTIYVGFTIWDSYAYHGAFGNNLTTTQINVTYGLDNPDWLTWSSGNSTLWGTPSEEHEGYSWTINVTATNAIGGVAYQEFDITVGESWAPTFTSSPDEEVQAGHDYEYSATTNESVTWNALKTNATFLDWSHESTSTIYIVNGTPEAVDIGWYWVNVSGYSIQGYDEGWQNYTLTVTEPDPEFDDESPPTTALTEILYYFNVSTDLDCSFEWITNGSSWLSNVNDTDDGDWCNISGTPGVALADQYFWVNITATSDLYSTTAWLNWTIAVSYDDTTDPVVWFEWHQAGNTYAGSLNFSYGYTGYLIDLVSGATDDVAIVNWTWVWELEDVYYHTCYGESPEGHTWLVPGNYSVNLTCRDAADNYAYDKQEFQLNQSQTLWPADSTTPASMSYAVEGYWEDIRDWAWEYGAAPGYDNTLSYIYVNSAVTSSSIWLKFDDYIAPQEGVVNYNVTFWAWVKNPNDYACCIDLALSDDDFWTMSWDTEHRVGPTSSTWQNFSYTWETNTFYMTEWTVESINELAIRMEFYNSVAAENQYTRCTMAGIWIQWVEGDDEDPVADAGDDRTFYFDPIGDVAAGYCTLDGTGSTDNFGIVNYTWTWSGGTAYGSTPSVWLSEGTYEFTLNVTDAMGLYDTDTVNITVEQIVPPAYVWAFENIIGFVGVGAFLVCLFIWPATIYMVRKGAKKNLYIQAFVWFLVAAFLWWASLVW